MKRDQLKTGVLLSYLNLLIGNLIPFIYTPMMLRMMGQGEYGIYGMAQSIMGYLQLLNFGIGGSIVRYLAKYRAQGDKEGEKRLFGLFIKIYTVIGAVVLIAGMALSFNLGFFGRSLNTDELVLLRRLVQLMTINCAVFMPFSVYSSMIIAHEQFILEKLVALLLSIFTPITNIVLLFYGYGAIGLVITAISLNVIAHIVYVYYVHKRLDIAPSFGRVSGSLLYEILGYSAFVFLGLVVDTLYWATDKLIIGWAIGATATAIYNIGASFNGYLTSFSTAVSSLLIPKLTNMVVKDAPKEEFTALFIKVGRLQFIIVSFILSAFIAFGRPFIELWVGVEYSQAYNVALLTMIPVAIPLIQNTGINILYALNMHRFRSIVYTCIACINIILTFMLVETYGIIGAAAATCIAYVLGNIIIINWYYHKRIGINIPLFWKNIIQMCPIMIVMGGSFYFLLSHALVDRWSVFLGFAVIYCVIYFVLAYCFMMNPYERSIVLIPLKKLAKTIHRVQS